MDADEGASFDLMPPHSEATDALRGPWLSIYMGAAQIGTAHLLLIVRELFRESDLDADERALAMDEMLQRAAAKGRRWLARAAAGTAPAPTTRIECLLAAYAEAARTMQWAIDDFAGQMEGAPGDATKH